MLSALHALKFALQNSPGFNNTVLVAVLRHELNNSANHANRSHFEAPLLALLHDHVITPEGTGQIKPLERN